MPFTFQHASSSAETNSTDSESLENVIDLPVYRIGVVVAVVAVVVVVVVMVTAVAVVVVVLVQQ